MKIEGILFCGIGKVRKHNEDNYFFQGKKIESINKYEVSLKCNIDTQRVDFAVFDGMGGASCGEIASRIAVDSFESVVEGKLSIKEYDLLRFYTVANNAICEYMEKNKLSRMGSTAATLSISNHEILASCLGDSKILRVRDNCITQITEDHTEAAFLFRNGIISKDEISTHPGSSVLTQHLGIFPDELIIEPFFYLDTIKSNDMYILLTDGVSNYISTDELMNIFSSESLTEIADQINNIVYSRKAVDNFTYIIVRVGENYEKY